MRGVEHKQPADAHRHERQDLQYRRDTLHAPRVADGPQVTGTIRASRANTSASIIAPTVEISHPSRLTPPYGASDAGSRNTPDPIMLPMTSATVVEKPMVRAVTIPGREE